MNAMCRIDNLSKQVAYLEKGLASTEKSTVCPQIPGERELMLTAAIRHLSYRHGKEGEHSWLLSKPIVMTS